MLPLSGSPRSRSRKSSADHSGPNALSVSAAAAGHVPTSFFMRSESELEMQESMASASFASENTGSAPSVEGSRQLGGDSNYGVTSLADTLESAFGEEGGSGAVEESPSGKRSAEWERPVETGLRGMVSQRRAQSSSKHSESSVSPPRRHKRKTSEHTAANPVSSTIDGSSLFLATSSAVPGGTPRSLSMTSLKLSDEESMAEDGASQVLASSSEEEGEEGETAQMGDSSFPQLVMPSIQMPTRRPFTANGRAMGKLKVLIAGAAGTSTDTFI